jgi:hypothetical protein
MTYARAQKIARKMRKAGWRSVVTRGRDGKLTVRSVRVGRLR